MEIKELVLNGNVIPGYYIRNDGQLFSTRAYMKGVNRFTSHDKNLVCYGSELREVKGTRYQKYTHYCIGKKFTYRENDGGLDRKGFKVLAHRAVMETFSPFEDNLPDDLIDEWPKLSKIVKKYIKNGMTVDHINPNLKEGFNSLFNLQWMTLSENSSKSDREPNALEKLLWN
tara:strand:- start:195 stop:710 length:516 start_codon:yes stop_codon:yes gene_type:complete